MNPMPSERLRRVLIPLYLIFAGSLVYQFAWYLHHGSTVLMVIPGVWTLIITRQAILERTRADVAAEPE